MMEGREKVKVSENSTLAFSLFVLILFFIVPSLRNKKIKQIKKKGLKNVGTSNSERTGRKANRHLASCY